VASVNAGEWWPSIIWTCFAFQPLRNIMDALVCLNVWKPTQESPTLRAAGFKTRLNR
jgi:hypothetical protein